MTNGTCPDQHPVRAPELALFPWTASLRSRIRIILLVMAGLTFGLGVALRECGLYVLGVFSLLCDVPIEVVFAMVRRRRAIAYHSGEDKRATVVKKRAFPIGPQFAVVIRYSARDTVIESSRHVPFSIWLPLRIGALVPIRVDREQARNWVFRWEEQGSAAGSADRSGSVT